MDVERLKKILLEHQYTYVKEIGKGSFGRVILVTSLKYQSRDFVVKVIPSNPNLKVSYKDTEHEASVLIKLCQPNIISMYEFFADDERKDLFIVLEYCQGGSIQEMIDKNGPIKMPLIMTYAEQVIKALAYCHAHNVAHRDIKPANILIDNYGRLKLADFGLSMRFGNNESNRPTTFAGSKAYMAPEILQKIPNSDPFLADIWSLGITLYTMGVGTTPWPDDTSKIDLAVRMGMLTFPPDLDIRLIKLIKSMVVTNPNKRASLQEILNDPLFGGDSPSKVLRTLHGDHLSISQSASLKDCFKDNQAQNKKKTAIKGTSSYYPKISLGSLEQTGLELLAPNKGQNLRIQPTMSVKSFVPIGSHASVNSSKRRMSHAFINQNIQTFVD